MAAASETLTFTFTNLTNLKVSVALESPAGTLVDGYEVGPDDTKTFYANVHYARSARLRVNDGTHETVQEVSVDGRPSSCLITALICKYRVGTIQGDVRASY
jgi:hypothetical protein